MLTTRRRFLGSALALPAAAALTRTADPLAPRLLVVDSRWREPWHDRPPRDVAVLPGGDVTRLWAETLSDAWRRPGFVVAGETGADALFVLERLGWGRGRRVVASQTLAGRERDGIALVRWTIAPAHPRMKS